MVSIKYAAMSQCLGVNFTVLLELRSPETQLQIVVVIIFTFDIDQMILLCSANI